MEGQLRKLRNRIHPKIGAELPEAVELDRDQQSQSARSVDERRILPDKFYTYVAVEPPPLTPSDPEASARRRDEILTRIKVKIAANKAVNDARVQRASMTCKGKYRILVKGAACHGRACCEGT